MSKESSFLHVKVECPICQTINEFEIIKVGAYTEEGRDTDFCPTGLKWRHPRYQGYNPLVFFTAVCSNCFYSRELSHAYRDWKNDASFKTYRLKPMKEKHLESLSVANSVVREMGDAINISNFPNESAILKLHLAVFDEMLNEIPNNLDLGRFYVRLGWVYRSMNSGVDPSQLFISGLMDELDNKFALLRNSVESMDNDLQGFEKHVKSHFSSSELSSDMKSQMLPYEDKFENQIGNIRGSAGTLAENLQGMREMIEQYKDEIVGDTDVEGAVRFANQPSFRHFLKAIKKRWEWVALDEKEALQNAVKFYCRAYEGGKDIAAGNQELQVTYLIAELSRRVGNHDLARQYFNGTIKAGQEFIYRNRNDQSRTVLARKIMELAIEQGRANLEAAKAAK